MIKTNRLFFGKLCILGFERGRNGKKYMITYRGVDEKYRLFYLLDKNRLKDIESGEWHVIKSFTGLTVLFDELISLRDFFPTVNFPNILTRKQLLNIINLSNEMQCAMYKKGKDEQERIKFDIADEISNKVLKIRKNKHL